MTRMSEENSTELTRIYGAAALEVGILFLFLSFTL